MTVDAELDHVQATRVPVKIRDLTESGDNIVLDLGVRTPARHPGRSIRSATPGTKVAGDLTLPTLHTTTVITTAERVLRTITICLTTVLAAGVATLVLDRVFETPQELALKAENEALRSQITSISDRIEEAQLRLDRLGTRDAELYRTLLGAESISDDERQVGVGGAEAHSQAIAFSIESAQVLSESSESLERLERGVALQTSSFRELDALIDENRAHVSEIPAIIPADGPIASGFGMRMHPILNVIRPHWGIDIVVPVGSKVVAPGDGIVTAVGRGVGLGRFVRVSHPGVGYETTFAHLSRIGKHVRKGLRVRRGEVIGYSGNTGLSRAPHLHYEVRNKDGKALDPLHFIAPGMTPAAYLSALQQAEASTVFLD